MENPRPNPTPDATEAVEDPTPQDLIGKYAETAKDATPAELLSRVEIAAAWLRRVIAKASANVSNPETNEQLDPVRRLLADLETVLVAMSFDYGLLTALVQNVDLPPQLPIRPGLRVGAAELSMAGQLIVPPGSSPN